MAEKKRSSGCLLGGCLLLVVVGGALAVVGLAGSGAWYWYGASNLGSAPMEVERELPGEPPPIPSVEPEEALPVVPDLATPGVTQVPAVQPAAEPQDLAAARSALEQASAPTEPRSAPSSSGGGGGSRSAASEPTSSAAPPPEAAPAEAPAVSTGSGHNVTVEGPASVVLISSAGRFPVPGSIVPGRYEVEATFPGDEPVKFGNLTVARGGSYTVVCNPRMGICRAN
ncbi:MAG: hypothetical protein ABIO70_05190 [Pseudomonadota bacterium]